MDRRIALAIPELGLSASVRMLVDRAPLTCAAIWDALETPVERRLIHTATTGPVVFFYNFPALRDAKDLRFGMGLSASRVGEPTKRDRLLLVSAFAMALLTLLGAVGESLGMDRLLKSNTSKTRTHSLFRQGCMLYELMPNMPEHRLAPLIAKFAEALAKAAQFGSIFTAAEMRG